MRPEHAEWIVFFESACAYFVRGKCKQAATKMAREFPELRVAAGFAHWNAGREIRDQHWWCVDTDGTIVDPTRAQFTGPVMYEELDVNDPKTRALVPTGRCMDCGRDVYNHDRFCSRACADATERWLNDTDRH